MLLLNQGGILMKTKKLLSIVLTLLLVLTVGSCKNNQERIDDINSEAVSSAIEEPPPITYTYSLTGLETTTPIKNNRPVAVTINNVYLAQKIQTGVGHADVVFETEVEGGITRLLAFFQNPTKEIAQIGSVRSVRVVFAELVASMDALLIYHGTGKYAGERMSQLGIKKIGLNTNNYGKRIPNGLDWEHTLYTNGENLEAALDNTGYGQGGIEEPWLNFSDEEITPSLVASTKATAKFNATYNTCFIYDSANKTYQRGTNNSPFIDYVTGETENFKNVFVLQTTMRYYSDGKMRDIDLDGGKGYYVTNGGYQEITWSKSGDYSPIKFKDMEGNELAVNKGNSYICIMNQSTSSFTAE